MFESLRHNGAADKSAPHFYGENETGQTPSPKQLGWLLGTTDHRLLVITPALADAMLQHNDKNRPLSPVTVKKYARQMKAGLWRLTKQPIIFSKSRRLQDGQHRLHACVESGVAFQAWVDFGDDDGNFAFIDIGKPRGASDIFAISGVQNAGLIAAASRLIYGYDTGRLTGSKTGLAVSPTPKELFEFYQTCSHLEKSLPAARLFKESRLAPPSMMMAMHYICARKSRAQADIFFEKVATGIGFTNNKEPAYKLHKRLVDNLTGAARLPSLVMAAYTVKAWNCLRTGKPVGLLRWRGEQKPDESFPKAI